MAFVAATAAPVGMTDGSFTPAEKELGTSIERAAPPDARLYVTPEAQYSFHGGFAMFFYAEIPAEMASPDRIESAESVQYALLLRTQLVTVARDYEVLVSHGDRVRDAYSFDAKVYREVVAVKFESETGG